MSRGYRPRFLWGGSSDIANAVDFGYPLDSANAYSMDREGSEAVQLASGVEDASQAGQDYYLDGVARWIPAEDALASGSVRRATGWNGTTGVDAALHWMRGRRTARFYPDNRNLALNPTAITDTNADGVANDWTADWSGVSGTRTWSIASGQQLVVTGANTGYYWTRCRVPGLLPGETLTFGADITTSGLSSSQCFYEVQARTSADAFLSNVLSGTTGSASTRVTGTASALPATTACAYINIGVQVFGATGSGTVTFTNVSLRRDGSSAYVANEYVACYLVPDGLGTAPTLERDASRSVALRLRATSAFTGY